MVTSTNIIGKVNLTLCINIPNKTIFLAAFRASGLIASFVFLKCKTVFNHDNFV